MMKLVLQHKQIDHAKSSNVEELHYFFNKTSNSSSEKHENIKSGSFDTFRWHKTFCYIIFGIANKNHNEYQNKTHNLQSSFDSILIVFHSIMVFSVNFWFIFNYRECSWYSKFFLNITFSYQRNWPWFPRI